MDINYIAGFIDGEGHVGIIKSSPDKKWREVSLRYTPKITIINTNREILSEIKNELGGLITKRKKEKEHHRVTYSLQIYGKALNSAIPKLLPFLIGKKDELHCLEEMIKTQRHTARGNGYTKEELKVKKELYQKCLDLKRM